MNQPKIKFGKLLIDQIMAITQFLSLKSQPKKELKPRTADGRRIKKQGYKPGTVGLSKVSAAIKKDYGRILNRKERKRLVSKGKPFKTYYNN